MCVCERESVIHFLPAESEHFGQKIFMMKNLQKLQAMNAGIKKMAYDQETDHISLKHYCTQYTVMHSAFVVLYYL